MQCSMIPVSSVSRRRWVSLTGNGPNNVAFRFRFPVCLRQLTEQPGVRLSDARPRHFATNLLDSSLPLLQSGGTGQETADGLRPSVHIAVRDEQILKFAE